MDVKDNSLKRALEMDQEAVLIDLMTGKKITVNNGFCIGRAQSSNLLIERIYISRVQCIIKYEDNHFVLHDFSSSSSTRLNCARLRKGASPCVLQHGDIISFGDENRIEFVYKFILETNLGKKFKSDSDEAMEDLAIKNKQLQSDILKLDSAKNKFMKDYNNLKELTITKLAGFRRRISDVLLITKAHFQLVEKRNLSVNSLKSEIYERLEDNFQCAICNEIVVKATIGSCSHTFCENCISTWLIKSKLCPVCRTTINSTNNTIAVDNFISDMCGLFGGSIKEQRDALQTERNVPISTRVRSRSNLNRLSPVLQQRTRSTNRFTHRPDNRRNVDVVDLTHLG